MKKYIKKMSFVLIVAMIFSLISPIKNIKTYAMVNTDYYDLVSNSSIADQNGDDEASEPGTLLGLVMIAVLQVGKLVENLVVKKNRLSKSLLNKIVLMKNGLYKF